MAPTDWSRRVRLLGRRILYGPPPADQTLVQVGKLDYDGAEILIGVTSRRELIRLRSCAKEPWTVTWIERNVGPGDVLYDIGANIGAYALVAAKASRGTARVFAFEPAFASYAALCENVVLNACETAVAPLPVVLSSETRLDVLEYSDVSAGAAIHTLASGTERGSASGFRQPVLTYRLDDLVEQFGLPAPTLVKLDVDGAEASVLLGAERTLSRPELRSLLVEVERGRDDEVLAAVGRLGLSLAERIDERAGEWIDAHWYGIFERPGAG